MNEAGKGVAAMVTACMIWGLSPLYYKLLAHVPPLELLAHRTFWSLIFFGTVLALQARLGEVRRLLLSSPRQVAAVGFAAGMISTNWFFFIYSVQIGRVVESSLGYYIFPLVSVMLGVLVYREGMDAAKAVAVGLAATAVIVLTLGLGVAPWVSLVLAFSFGFYGMVKKYVAAGAVVSVTAEVVLLVPLALFWLWGVHSQGWTGLTGTNLATFGRSLSDSALLMLSGPLTATPLILFSYASRRVTMATVGLVQYLNPTLQFAVAVAIFAEPFTRWHAIAFPLIWVALAIYTLRTWRQERSARRAATSSSTVATVVK
ncbi:EamA family transporter RarD [Psychromarinibacter sp. C21-152]|uniref:EamA family transporter RarD n=2 Tax=Psychromarinibacter sediminicola TaxID=3033385 RepID=A0AAE3NVM3_9RHOB|nr:EamA family transporter RarD [Psychromarinibacter sediminicola]